MSACPACQWLDYAPEFSGLMLEAAGDWGIWWPEDAERVNDLHELGTRAADFLQRENEPFDVLPAAFDWQIRTAEVVYDPETDHLYHEDGPSIVFASFRPCSRGHQRA